MGWVFDSLAAYNFLKQGDWAVSIRFIFSQPASNIVLLELRNELLSWESTVKKSWKRTLGGILVIAGGVALAGWVFFILCFTRPPTYEPATVIDAVELRSWPEHDAIYGRTAFPYLLRLQSGLGRILYIGVRHTSEATDSQLAEIERLWAKFQPTVALCEGRARMFRFASRPTSGPLGEWKLVRILARRGDVPLYSLEPAYEVEVRHLVQLYDSRLVATYLTLRGFTSDARDFDGDLDALARRLLRKRTNVAELRGSLDSIEDLDAFWQERFPQAPDWRTLSDTEGLPLLVEVGHASREVRGQHMVQTLVDLATRGERVLAVVGASHVIRQEPALGQVLDKERPPAAADEAEVGVRLK